MLSLEEIGSADDLVKYHEGLILVAKADAKGKWSIGWGHDIPAPPEGPTACTEDEAEAWRVADMATATKAVEEFYRGALAPARRAVLIDMAYELGAKGLGEFHALRSAMALSDWAEAQRQGLASLWAREVPARAKLDMRLMLTGLWPKEDNMADEQQEQQQTSPPPPPPAAPMNMAHVTAAGISGMALTNALTDVYQWIHWPLRALDHPTAHSLAVLTLAVLGGGGLAYFKSGTKAPASQNSASIRKRLFGSRPAAPPAQS